MSHFSGQPADHTVARTAAEMATRRRHHSAPSASLWQNLPDFELSEEEELDRSLMRRTLEQEALLKATASLDHKFLAREDSTFIGSAAEQNELSLTLNEILPSALSLEEPEEETESNSRSKKPILGSLSKKIKKNRTSTVEGEKEQKDRRKTYGSEKKSKLEVKVTRVRQYWRKDSMYVPNVYRILAESDEPNFILEFQDFSAKEVLAEGLIELN